MSFLKSLAVDDLTINRDYSIVLNGDLLLVGQDINSIGIRSVFVSGDGSRNFGLVPLEGSKKGVFISDHDMHHLAAINVTKLVKIVVREPTADRVKSGSLQIGDVCTVNAQEGLYMAIAHPSEEKLVGGVVKLRWDTPGQVFRNSNVNLRLGVVGLETIGQIASEI